MWNKQHTPVFTISTDRSNLDGRLFLLSVALRLRYDQNKNILDLARAIGHAKTLLANSHGQYQHGFKLGHLSHLLRLRFTRLGDVKDADEAAERCAAAIHHHQVALSAVPENNHRRYELLHGLSDELADRSERPEGLASDLEKAIQYGQEARHETRESLDSCTAILIHLARCFRVRYDRLQVLDDIETSIQHTEEALAILPDQGGSIHEPELRANALFTFSTCLQVRYNKLGAPSDNTASIQHAEASVAATPEFSINRGGRLRHWSRLLTSSYYLHPVPSDLSAIIQCTEAALLATREDDIDRAGAISMLVVNLLFRYFLHGRVEDIEAALKHGRAALALTPPGHIDRRVRLSNLGNLLHCRYHISGNLADNDEPVELMQEAVPGLPTDHFDYHYMMTAAAAALTDRYNKTGSVDDRKQAFVHLMAAYNCNMASPMLRVLQVREIIANFRSPQTPNEPSPPPEDALSLIPKISLRFLGREDLQHLLSKLHGLPSAAASFALEAGREASHALKLLELGRGIITGFGIDSRSELSELEETHPQLFQSFMSLRAVINSTEGGPQDPADGLLFKSNTHFSSKRMRATLDLEPVLNQIGQIPTYERFLLPPSPTELMKIAECGTIVIVNTTDLRSDAIIVTSSAITALALPKLAFVDAKERMQQLPQLFHGKRSTYPRRTKQMNELLAWLWDAVVELVLGKVQPNGVDNQTTLPRVWWIGAGVLGRAPFHAAGRDHSASSTSNTLNRVLSSYIPTIKALAYTRQQELHLVGKPDTRLLLVAMPTTPGCAALPGVDREIADIIEILRNCGVTGTTVLTQPSSATVVHHLQLSDAVHFACHGISDSSNPSNSSLVLMNDTPPATADRLTAKMISQAHTKRAQIAYLSACNTADNPAVSLADETIHLASSFQLAGFNHVLGIDVADE